jgi:hypothetical protein
MKGNTKILKDSSASSKKWWFERNPFLTLLIFLFFIITLTDFLLGVFLIPPDITLFRSLHPYYHHGLLPDKKAIATWGPIAYPFYTNSLGMRDTGIVDVPLTTRQKRILLLGDSHTEAVGVYAEDSFYGILKKAGKRKGIEVLNGAVVSYSPKIHYLKAKYYLEKRKLDIDEIWVFIDLSDLQNEIAYETFIPRNENIFNKAKDKLFRFLKKNSFTVNRIEIIRDSRNYARFTAVMSKFDQQRGREFSNNTIELYRVFFRDFNDKELLQNPEFHGVGQWYYDSSFIQLADKGLNLGMENIRRLDSLCIQKKINLTLCVHPWQIQVMKQDTCDYYVRRWADFCKSQNITFINLFPVFINGENPEAAIKKYYIPNDNHWSEQGHAKVARHLQKYMVP